MNVHDRVASKSLETFPERLVPNGEWKAIKRYEDPDFGIGGVDGQYRLVVFDDDGTVHGFALENASAKRTRFGWKLDTDRETLAHRQFGEEYMYDRDVADWIWVSPRYEYLTAGESE